MSVHAAHAVCKVLLHNIHVQCMLIHVGILASTVRQQRHRACVCDGSGGGRKEGGGGGGAPT